MLQLSVLLSRHERIERGSHPNTNTISTEPLANTHDDLDPITSRLSLLFPTRNDDNDNK